MPRFFIKKAPPKEHSPNPVDHREVLEDHEDKEDGSLIKTLISWAAPSRPYRQKDRSYYTTIAIIASLLILIVLLAQEFMLIGVILALAFVAYVLGFVPPEEVEYKISTQGVTIEGQFYFWEDLDSFWFTEKEGHKVLHIVTRLRFPPQLMIVLGNSSEDQVKKYISRYLPYHEIPPRSLMDKWAEGLQKHFPLENPRK